MWDHGWRPGGLRYSPAVDPSPVRTRLSEFLHGSGIELGPGHSPYAPLPHGTSVRYVDRWQPEQNSSLFRELGGDAHFPRPDVVANFDVDRLDDFPDQSEDFVICSHVLEHVANPIALLRDIYRVLRPGGTLLLLLPDRHRTFDSTRVPTSLAHLVVEFEKDVTEVDDLHIEEFLDHTNIGEGQTTSVPEDPEERRALFELHRRRSIHVHCWDQEEFVDVLTHGIECLGQQWEFLDGVSTVEGGPDGIEFGFVLQRGETSGTPTAVLEQFTSRWESWKDDRDRWVILEAERPPLTRNEYRLFEELQTTRGELAAARAELTNLQQSKTWRYTAVARRLYHRARPAR
ncbi:MAG TPA: methyltransferase domain-containing protein [Acidimicrobiales bacterium]